MKNLFFNILVVCSLSGCVTETIQLPRSGNDNQTGITGEINNTSDMRIGVYYAGNLTSGVPPRFVDNALIRLESKGNTVCTFTVSEQQQYQPDRQLLLQPGQSFRFLCELSSETYTADLQMPDSFRLEGQVRSDSLMLSLSSDTNKAMYYIAELYTRTSGNQTVPVALTGPDRASDNFRYNELPSGTNTLFINALHDKLTLVCRFDKAAVNDTLIVSVKSVDSAYYHYLYYSYVQQNVNKLHIPLPTNISNTAIGYVGAAWVRKTGFYLNR